MKITKITYDKLAEAIYISLRKENQKFSKTLPLNDTTILDLDMEENIMGIEILFVDKNSRAEDYIKSIELLCKEPFSEAKALKQLKAIQV